MADAGEGEVDFFLGEVLGAEEGDLLVVGGGGDGGVLEDWGWGEGWFVSRWDEGVGWEGAGYMRWRPRSGPRGPCWRRCFQSAVCGRGCRYRLQWNVSAVVK